MNYKMTNKELDYLAPMNWYQGKLHKPKKW